MLRAPWTAPPANPPNLMHLFAFWQCKQFRFIVRAHAEHA